MSKRRPVSKFGNPIPPKEGLACHCGKIALRLVKVGDNRTVVGYCGTHSNEAVAISERINNLRCWKSDYLDDKRTRLAKSRDNRKHRHALR